MKNNKFSNILDYALVIGEDEKGWPATNFEINNFFTFNISNFEVKGTLRNHFDIDYSIETQRIIKFPQNSKYVFNYGDWSDFALVFFEIKYYRPTAQSEAERKKIKKLNTPFFKNRPEFASYMDELDGFLSEGNYNIDFVAFDFSQVGPAMPGKVIKPAICKKIPSLYTSLIKSHWYDFLSIERITPIISYFKSNTLLILGKDTGEGLERLRTISKEMKNLGYESVLLKDVNDIRGQSLEEKLLSFAMLSRFVIVDDSEPSGHINELSILSRNRVVTVIMRKEGIGGTFMQIDYEVDFGKLMKIWPYDSEDFRLKEKLNEAVQWANDVISKRKNVFSELYKWQQ